MLAAKTSAPEITASGIPRPDTDRARMPANTPAMAPLIVLTMPAVVMKYCSGDGLNPLSTSTAELSSCVEWMRYCCMAGASST
ncbi:hypothetical protein D9M69_650780 [compost metagenome]